MVLGGAFHIYIGYQFYLLPLLIPQTFQTIFGTLMIAFGFLSVCASLAVWLQKSWATKIIAGVGVASCVTLVIFGYYLMIILVALLYKAAIDHLRISRVIEHSDWHEN